MFLKNSWKLNLTSIRRGKKTWDSEQHVNYDVLRFDAHLKCIRRIWAINFREKKKAQNIFRFEQIPHINCCNSNVSKTLIFANVGHMWFHLKYARFCLAFVRINVSISKFHWNVKRDTVRLASLIQAISKE